MSCVTRCTFERSRPESCRTRRSPRCAVRLVISASEPSLASCGSGGGVLGRAPGLAAAAAAAATAMLPPPSARGSAVRGWWRRRRGDICSRARGSCCGTCEMTRRKAARTRPRIVSISPNGSVSGRSTSSSGDTATISGGPNMQTAPAAAQCSGGRSRFSTAAVAVWRTSACVRSLRIDTEPASERASRRSSPDSCDFTTCSRRCAVGPVRGLSSGAGSASSDDSEFHSSPPCRRRSCASWSCASRNLRRRSADCGSRCIPPVGASCARAHPGDR